MQTRLLVAANLKRLREARGFTQEALALEAAVDRTMVGRLERGERSVSTDLLDRLSRVLRVETVEFFVK